MGRILVVDDEPLVAEMVGRTLEEEHSVAVQSSAQGALELVDKGERFDLVVSDLQMPDLDGIGLRDALAQRDPALARRMLFLTGGATTPGTREFLAREDVHSLEKPFRAPELLAIVRRLLGG